jgi:N-acetylglucosaminyldiphosphoundecaprenol N-acetyl-beta-D-mannosaminyltransferase
VATANLDFLALARKQRTLAEDLRRSTLVVADGMPVRWLARLAGAARARRVAGVDLVTCLCQAAGTSRGLRVSLYGGQPEVAARAAERLAGLGPRIVIAAVVTPPFRKLAVAELDRFRDELVESRPEVVLVALGCPAQERLIAEWHPALPGALWIGVGGTFDLLTGRRRRAPRLIQSAGMEWIFRMVQEPRRLGRRYLGRDVPAAAVIAWQLLLERLWRRPSASIGPREDASYLD